MCLNEKLQIASYKRGNLMSKRSELKYVYTGMYVVFVCSRS